MSDEWGFTVGYIDKADGSRVHLRFAGRGYDCWMVPDTARLMAHELMRWADFIDPPKVAEPPSRAEVTEPASPSPSSPPPAPGEVKP